MIETVINIHGVEEKFDAKKLNHWVQDATDGMKAGQWNDLALEAIRGLPAKVTVQQLIQKLIDVLLARETWTHYMLAGKLLATLIRMEIFGTKVMPSVREVQQRLHAKGLMRDLKYSEFEWAAIEASIDHDQDFKAPHFALEQIRYKYSLQDYSEKLEFETQQYVYMRMAMALFESSPETPEDAVLFNDVPAKRTRLEHVLRIYKLFSKKRLSAPTPNYNNLGTYHRGYASCCLITSDDNRYSLAAADHIAYMMTTQSAGIGSNYQVRSIGDPVQKGRFLHRGKKPYIDVFGKIIRANLQGGRGGAGTWYDSVFDPEAKMTFGLRDPRAEDNARNRDAHYAFLTNRFMTMKFSKNEDIFAFNCYTAPELHEAFYSDDTEEFARLYAKYEADPKFVKKYINARELMTHLLNQGVSTGTIYAASIDEMNRNTPFVGRINSSNLCLEVAEPTTAYTGPDAMKDLHSEVEVGHVNFYGRTADQRRLEYAVKASDVFVNLFGRKWEAHDTKVGMIFMDMQHGPVTVEEIISIKKEPEVALCSLAAVNLTEEISNDEYLDLMYYAYKMIDYCILENEYILPHMGVTAKARMNAGVGMMGLATHMARRKLKYTEAAGLQELHAVFERHMWFAIKASILISKERGLAPWIHRTKWPEGWTPVKGYRKEVDALGDFKYNFNWDEISNEIIANGGLAHSCLVNFMPGESSSKALAAVNSIYGVRKVVMIKVDGTNVIRWAAPHGDNPEYEYQSMWSTELTEQNTIYALAQKFSDQSVSADWYIDFTHTTQISSKKLLNAEADRVKKGVKTRYYINTLMPANEKSMTISQSVHDEPKVHPNGFQRGEASDGFPVTEPAGLHEGNVQPLSPEIQAMVDAGVNFEVSGGDGHMECEGCSI